VILGRSSYDQWARFWPDSEIQPFATDVVDELRLVIAPTIVGSGRRLLDGLPATRLEPIRSRTSPGGHLLVDYRLVP
jgi:dihydrofolate reductase